MSDQPFLEGYLYESAATPGKAPVRYVAVPDRRAPAYLAAQLRQIFLGAMTPVLAPECLTASHWGVMVAVMKEPGIDQRRLAERRGIDTNSASRLVDELAELGLVSRKTSSDDRRANAIELTAAGRKRFLRLRPVVLTAQDQVLHPLTQAEKRTFMDLLTRVVAGNQSLARPGNGRRRPTGRADRAKSEPRDSSNTTDDSSRRSRQVAQRERS
jgi:DNA-binding MarR family transcriptional regulator